MNRKIAQLGSRLDDEPMDRMKWLLAIAAVITLAWAALDANMLAGEPFGFWIGFLFTRFGLVLVVLLIADFVRRAPPWKKGNQVKGNQVDD